MESCVPGLKSLEIEAFGSRESSPAIDNDHVRSFVNWVKKKSSLSFWRVGAGLAVENAMFRSFGLKSSELGVRWVDEGWKLMISGIASKHHVIAGSSDSGCVVLGGVGGVRFTHHGLRDNRFGNESVVYGF